jgi:hypothetical protein
MKYARAVIVASLVLAAGLVGVVNSPAQAWTQPSDICREGMSPVGGSTLGAAYTVGTMNGVAVSPAGTPVTPNGGPYAAIAVRDGGIHGVYSVEICVSSNAWNDYSHAQTTGGWYYLSIDPGRNRVTFRCVPNNLASVKLTCSNYAQATDPRPGTPGMVVTATTGAQGTYNNVGATGAEAGYTTLPFDPWVLTYPYLPIGSFQQTFTVGTTTPCVYANGTQPLGACGTSNLASATVRPHDVAWYGTKPVCLDLPGRPCLMNGEALPVHTYTGPDPANPTVKVTVLNIGVPVDVPGRCLTFC